MSRISDRVRGARVSRESSGVAAGSRDLARICCSSGIAGRGGLEDAAGTRGGDGEGSVRRATLEAPIADFGSSLLNLLLPEEGLWETLGLAASLMLLLLR